MAVLENVFMEEYWKEQLYDTKRNNKKNIKEEGRIGGAYNGRENDTYVF